MLGKFHKPKKNYRMTSSTRLGIRYTELTNQRTFFHVIYDKKSSEISLVHNFAETSEEAVFSAMMMGKVLMSISLYDVLKERLDEVERS